MTAFARLVPVLLIAVVLAGCARRVSHSTPAAFTTMAKPSTGPVTTEMVDPARIELDVKARTVKLYPLEGGGRWLVILPEKPQENIGGLEYRVPEDVKLDEVEVYFIVPGVRSSNAVKLAQVKKK